MKIRKSIALILMLCMVSALLSGCGSKKEKKPELVKGSIPEMVKAMQEVKEGTLQVDIMYTATYPYLENKTVTKNVGMELAFDRPNREYSLSVSYSDNDTDAQKFDKELVRITGNSVYFNLGAVSESARAGVIDEEKYGAVELSGWFEFPLPDELPKELPIDGFESSFFTLVEKAVKGLPTEGLDGDYTVTLKTKEDYAQLLNSLKDYAENDLNKAGDSVTGFKDILLKIDWNKYVEKILDMYENDVREAIKSFSEAVKFDESQIDGLVKEIKNQDFNKMMKEYLDKASEKKEGAAYLNQVARLVNELIRDLESDSDVTKDPAVVSVRVNADDSAYTVTIKSDKVAESTDATEIVFRLKPGAQSVDAPSDTKGIKQIADMLSTSYLAYVNKSRMSTDISTLDEYLLAAEKIAADPKFDLSEGSVFSIDITDGETIFSILSAAGGSAEYDAALEEWKYLCNYDDWREFKSPTMKKATVRFLGTVERDCNVAWKIENINDSFREMIDYSPDFKRKWIQN